MAKRVFVSYDHSEDAHYRDLLRAWDANTDFDFQFDLRSPTVPIDSSDASVIQGALTKKMKESDYILVIIGEKSFSSKWMKWEIQRAKEPDTNLKFAAVKVNSSSITPLGLPKTAPIANEFKLDNIVSALNNAVKYL